MSELSDFETYLYISPNKFGIYLFDKRKMINLYKEEIELESKINNLDINSLFEFLESNIFKIEKLIGKFIKNIILVIENNKILNINLGIKKKNYGETVNKKYLENTLTEANDLFRENCHDHRVMHMIINNYINNRNNYSSFAPTLFSDQLALEIEFICIPNDLVFTLDKILEKFQIKVGQYLDGNYITKFFDGNNFELTEMFHKIYSGCNKNEISLVKKNIKKQGFFERFFQLFS